MGLEEHRYPGSPGGPAGPGFPGGPSSPGSPYNVHILHAVTETTRRMAKPCVSPPVIKLHSFLRELITKIVIFYKLHALIAFQDQDCKDKSKLTINHYFEQCLFVLCFIRRS